MICDKCGVCQENLCGEAEEEHMFLLGIKDTGTELDGNYCVPCFAAIRPEFAEAIDEIARLMLKLLVEQEKYMSLEEWHELYGEPAESEE